MGKILKIFAIAFGAYLALHFAGGGAHTEKNISQNLASGNEVIMYSLTTCGYCAEKRAALNNAGIPFTEYFLDQDQSKMQELSGKLAAANIHAGGVGTPSFEVNGELLLNNPDMEEIKAHLKFKS